MISSALRASEPSMRGFRPFSIAWIMSASCSRWPRYEMSAGCDAPAPRPSPPRAAGRHDPGDRERAKTSHRWFRSAQGAGDHPCRLRIGSYGRRCDAAAAGGPDMTLARLDVETSATMNSALDRLGQDDALGQLLDRSGRMAALATENGDVKLDWSDQVAWALDHPQVIEEVETLAASIRSRFEHVIWSGMGGSVQAVHTLKGLFPGLAVHPLDSTDPAALNRVLREIAGGGAPCAGLRRAPHGGVAVRPVSE